MTDIDKLIARASECLHDSVTSRSIGYNEVRFTCHDCGETNDHYTTEGGLTSTS